MRGNATRVATYVTQEIPDRWQAVHHPIKYLHSHDLPSVLEQRGVVTSLIIFRRSYKKEIKMQSLLPLIFMSAVHVKVIFLQVSRQTSQSETFILG